MKVLYVDVSANIGGGEIYLRNLLAEPTPFDTQLISRHDIFSRCVYPRWGNIGKIIHLLFHADVIHLNGLRPLVLALLPGRFRVFMTQHASLRRGGSSLRYQLKKLALALLAFRIEKYICVAQYFVDELPSSLRSKAVVIANGVPPSNKENRLERGSRFAVLFLGRLEEAKGILDFCAMAELLLAKRSDVEFHVAGTGSLQPYVLSLAQRYSGQFICHGFVDHPHRLLQHMHALCLPSQSEGSSLSIIEAFMHQVPVLGYDVEGVREMVRDGENGILCPLEAEANGLAKGLGTMLDDQQTWQRLAESAYASYEREYTLERMRTRTFELYKQ